MASSYKTPRSGGISQKSTNQYSGSPSALSKEDLQAEIDRQEDIAQNATDPVLVQQAWLKLSELRSRYLST